MVLSKDYWACKLREEFNNHVIVHIGTPEDFEAVFGVSPARVQMKHFKDFNVCLASFKIEDHSKEVIRGKYKLLSENRDKLYFIDDSLIYGKGKIISRPK